MKKTSNWITFVIIHVAFMGVWGALVEIPEKNGFPPTLGFVVWALSMIPAAIVGLFYNNWKLETDRRSILLGSTAGLLGAIGQLVLFFTLKIAPAYLVFPLLSLTPVVTILLAVVFLKEKTGRLGWIGIGVAIAAIFLLSYQPSGDEGPVIGNTWMLLAAIPLLAWGAQGFVMRFANETMKAESIFFYMMATSVVLIPVALYMTDFSKHINWGFSGPYLAGMIQLLNAFGALFLVYAFRYGKAIIVAPMTTALSPVITVVLSLAIYAVIPHPLIITGMLLAIYAAYLMGAAEMKKEQEKVETFKKVVLVFISILIGFLSGPSVSAQNISIREENKTIKTYPYSDPNPVPALGINAKVGAFYPYFIFDGYTDTGIDKNWKVVTLENDYIEVTVLPEEGGKVMGAIEKSTGEEFIYLNHVQKFRSIGIRGPWTSGGIEHNFGLDLGHAPWTASEVDYVLKENADGSVSCVVGGLDLASRTQWRVDIRLPNDKAYFETRSMWYNPTPLHDAYLSWENAAYKATDDLQFYFSGTHHIGHSGDVHPWPIDEKGRDISIYKNNNFGTSKSYHVFGLTTNWYGGYYHNTNFGTGHWTSYDDAPGKKIWIWSLARIGAIWEGLLTDTDGQYIEAQSGVKFNQAEPFSGFNTPFNQLFMRPFYTETKNEYWFPVKETGGMVDASPTGTLNLVPLKDSLLISFCPNISIHDSLIVKSGEMTVLSEYIQLKPMQVYKKTITLPVGSSQVIRVNLGQDLLSYTSDIEENRVTRPIKTPAGQDFNSAEHLFRLAEDLNSMRNYDEALKTYFACLEKEPTHSRALAKVAELYYRKAQYTEALGYAEKVLENNTYDGNGNFIYGVIQKALGDLTNAKEGFSVAVRSMEFRSAAYVQIAGLYLQEQNYWKAIEYAEKSLDYNKYNVTAYEFLGTSFRKLNRIDEAREALEILLDIDPLNHYAHFEQYLLNPTPEMLSAFTSAIQNELAYETYLELALEYANQGLVKEATMVLEQSPKYPVVSYWLAYLTRESSPDKSAVYLYEALEMSPLLVFPFRLETIPVLTWAQEQETSWKSNYYLALIYWKILQPEKAKEEFENCGDTPDYAPFYIARGLFLQKNNFDIEAAGRDFKHAFILNPGEWRTAYYLSTYYQRIKKFDKQLEVSTQMYAHSPDNPVVGIAHARSLLNSEKNHECLKVLEEVNVLPAEFANAGHGIYEKANLNIALDMLEKGKFKKAIKYVNSSKKWPENLGSGAPYEPDNRLQDYISAYCESQLGNQEVADRYNQHVIDFSLTHRTSGEGQFSNYLAIELLTARGKSDDAKTYISTWEKEQNHLRDWKIAGGTSKPEVQWVLAKYYNEDEKVKKLESKVDENQPNSKFSLFLRAVELIGI